jgi:hypothetical protein
MKLVIGIFLKNLSAKFKFRVNLTRKKTFHFSHEALRIFFINSRSTFLIIKNVSEKSFRESQNTFCDNKSFFGKSCRLREKVKKYCSPLQVTTWG